MSMRRFGVPLWILRSRFKCRAFFSARVTHPNLCKTINIYIYLFSDCLIVFDKILKTIFFRLDNDVEMLKAFFFCAKAEEKPLVH